MLFGVYKMLSNCELQFVVMIKPMSKKGSVLDEIPALLGADPCKAEVCWHCFQACKNKLPFTHLKASITLLQSQKFSPESPYSAPVAEIWESNWTPFPSFGLMGSFSGLCWHWDSDDEHHVTLPSGSSGRSWGQIQKL